MLCFVICLIQNLKKIVLFYFIVKITIKFAILTKISVNLKFLKKAECLDAFPFATGGQKIETSVILLSGLGFG